MNTNDILIALEGKSIQSAGSVEIEYHGLTKIILVCTDRTTITIGCDTKNGGSILTVDKQ